jgi:glucose/arabinose dehydrogenase
VSRGWVALAAAAVLVGLAGCGNDDHASSGPGTTATTTTASGSGASGTAPAGPRPALGNARVRAVDLDLDLDSPVDVAFRPGSTSLLVAERGGTVREAVADGDGFRLADEPVLDITERVGSTESERGLLGLAVSPAGDRLYLSYTEAGHGDSRIDEFTLSGRDGSLRADPDSARTLVGIVQPFPNHNGGSLRFGPDGMLWAGFGDGGAADDPDGRAQDRSTLLGKILRLDPSRDDAVPTDNPFVDGGGEPLIWATGLRNPWRISFDGPTGDLWIGDVGQNEWEEVDVLRAADGTGRGANLGWDLFEGTARFGSPDPADGAASAGPFTAPVHVYSHDDGCSITGGVVARDPRIPALDGAYLFGDFCTPGVRAIRVDGTTVVDRADLGLDLSSVVSFGQGPDGRVYVISLDGGITRLDPA